MYGFFVTVTLLLCGIAFFFVGIFEPHNAEAANWSTIVLILGAPILGLLEAIAHKR